MSVQTISFAVNNGGKLSFIQRHPDGQILVTRETSTGDTISDIDRLAFIDPGEMVMLYNYRKYLIENNYRHEFLNPSGSNPEPR